MTAKPVSTQLNLQQIPLLGVVIESSATGSPPAAPVNGQLWFDTTVGRLYVREAGAWVLVSQTGSLTAASTAGGDLTGTLSNLQIAADVVTATEIASGVITDVEVAAANKDGAAGTASMRTIGTGATQAMAGNTRLDTIAIPTSSVSVNSQKITNLLAPTLDTDAANKAYVDAARSGLDVKQSVDVASTLTVVTVYNSTGGASNRGQMTTAPNTLDGVTLAANDRILLKDQTFGAENGIWVVTTVGSGANGVWDRASDFDSDAEVTGGAFVFVNEGTANADTGWVLTTNDPITIGGSSGTALAFAQFSSAGTISAGAGLTKTGSTIDAGGTANRISVSADSIDISSAYVGQTSITTLGTITTGVWTGTDVAVADGGTGASTAAGARANLGAVGKYATDLGALTAGVALTINHALNTTDVIASFRAVGAGGHEILMDWEVTDANNIKVTSDIAYGAAAIRATVIG